MRISLESLEFDGVGPFARKEKMDFGGANKAIIYAPNGHGKTASIDLVRWLLLGEKAREHFNSLEPDLLLNRERWAERGSGSVTLVVDIEGRGKHRIRRSQAVSKPTSDLTVYKWGQEEAKYEEVPNPHLFLMRFFPPERVGFNLLTGEHIESFQNQLSGEEVRRSIERLLAIPEIASAQEVLKEIASELEAQTARDEKHKRKSVEAEDARKRLRGQLDKAQQAKKDAVAKMEAKRSEVSELNQQIGKLKAGTATRDSYERAGDAVAAKEKEIDGVREDARERLSQSWRRLAIQAAQLQVQKAVKTYEEYDAARSEWEGRAGQRKLFEDILAKDECFCLRPVDAKARKRLESEISKIESTRPDAPPQIGVTPFTLNSWAQDDRYDGLVSGLNRLVENTSNLKADRARFEAEMKSIEKALDTGALKEISRLEKERMGVDAELAEALTRKDEATKRITEYEAQLQALDRELGNRRGAGDVGDVATLARAYERAFGEIVEAAIPWYRDQLQEKVQAVFRRLYQKDKRALVEFDPKSCIPRVILPGDGDGMPKHATLSEGEKMRLGLSLLIGLREVASERPFLQLDAPFSALDDPGIYSLLDVLGELDSQILIFTKNGFAPRPYGLVAAMKPKVFLMEWKEKSGKYSKGYTTISEGSLKDLQADEEDKK
ncbi:MAG: AAA family ATPase [Candidatus Thermoplasmatota archaeon]